MRVLLDQGTPVPLGKYLTAHHVETTFNLGWHTLRNGDLLLNAEAEGFEVLVPTDQYLKYQQNLSKRKISLVVITATSWPRIRKSITSVVQAIDSALPGAFVEVVIPGGS